MRAVNQALGRVVRHKDDFGAIILADERFAGAGTRNQVSYWARSMVTVQPSMEGLLTQLRPFFATNQQRYEQHQPVRSAAQPRAVLGRAAPPTVRLPLRLPLHASGCASDGTAQLSAGLRRVACLRGT